MANCKYLLKSKSNNFKKTFNGNKITIGVMTIHSMNRENIELTDNEIKIAKNNPCDYICLKFCVKDKSEGEIVYKKEDIEIQEGNRFPQKIGWIKDKKISNINEVKIKRGSIGKIDFDRYTEHIYGVTEYFYNDELVATD